MDKFRISYKCIKVPKSNSGMDGFEKDQYYTGRAFNGFYEISPQWGSGKPTKLISKLIFNEHFEVTDNELVLR